MTQTILVHNIESTKLVITDMICFRFFTTVMNKQKKNSDCYVHIFTQTHLHHNILDQTVPRRQSCSSRLREDGLSVYIIGADYVLSF